MKSLPVWFALRGGMPRRGFSLGHVRAVEALGLNRSRAGVGPESCRC